MGCGGTLGDDVEAVFFLNQLLVPHRNIAFHFLLSNKDFRAANLDHLPEIINLFNNITRILRFYLRKKPQHILLVVDHLET